jgi:hypothetical protein
MFVHCCHCLNCQRQTVSAFVIDLLIEADRVGLLTAEPHPVEAPRDDGSMQQIYRCPACRVAPWVELPDSVPAFEGYYDSKTLWPPESLERLRAVMSSRDSGRTGTA